jgi:hypothetical protein
LVCAVFLLCPSGTLRAQVPDQGAQSSEDSPVGKTQNVGTPYVELDSWIYPALERLGALGYANTQFLGMRPWTRFECALLVQEVGDKTRTVQSNSQEVNNLYDELLEEFKPDLVRMSEGGAPTIRLESLYGGATEIAGQPLNDSYHFGQTIINNFGRPYQRGFNSYDGFSGYAAAGRFTIYVRGEYQHAPSASAYSAAIRTLIGSLDGNPVLPAQPIATINQFALLDTYVGGHLKGWNLSFGKQSLWWGPDQGSAFLFSDNAAPIYMFRASRIVPFELPWIFRYLGPIKVDAFYGKLSGNQWPPRPLIHGEKISLKPTPNLELGFTRTVEFAGVGNGLTINRIYRSYFIIGRVDYATRANDPGKRTGGFDISYRVPFLRSWLTVYGDSISTDYASPIVAPRRSGLNPGFYLARLPKLPKLDLRAEGVNTVTYATHRGDFIYYDGYYHDLYTNRGNIIGSWIGREGQGIQAWATYWISPRNTLQFGYRHAKVASDFIPGGETLNDGSVKLDWHLHNDLNLAAFVQYEKWLAPVLASTPQTNWSSSIELSFQPRGWAISTHSQQ